MATLGYLALVALLVSSAVTAETDPIAFGGALGTSGAAGVAPGSLGALAGLRIRNPKLRNCGRTDVVKISDFSVSEDMKLTVSVDVLENIEAPIAVSLEVYKDLPWIGRTKIPCIGGKIGSCTYGDICSLPAVVARQEQCKAKTAAFGLDIPCSCPIAAKSYAVKDLPLRGLGSPNQRSGLGSFVRAGDISVKATITANGKPIGCHEFSATIA